MASQEDAGPEHLLQQLLLRDDDHCFETLRPRPVESLHSSSGTPLCLLLSGCHDALRLLTPAVWKIYLLPGSCSSSDLWKAGRRSERLLQLAPSTLLWVLTQRHFAVLLLLPVF
mmetsp:Transcript_86221/g.155310  ORF Transcript_86221/g.155310 Transcript_86221/m.155310 type:complete len:114 (+) Transcript_86221:216-557(+)